MDYCIVSSLQAWRSVGSTRAHQLQHKNNMKKKIFQYIVAGRLHIDDVNQQITWVLESGVLN